MTGARQLGSGAPRSAGLAARGRAIWLPRGLHPMAWWIWGIGLAVAVSLTTNPLLLLLAVAVAGLVVVTRRGHAPSSRGFGAYLKLGAVVLMLRLLGHVLFGSGGGGQLLLRLPQLQLPGWASGVSLGGPITLPGLLGAVVAAMQLAALLVCLGSVNTLANPKRALRLLPGALYDVGAAVVIAVTVAPQLSDSARRVWRARKLRGDTRGGLRAVRSVAMPVLADALARSLALAAAMDSRGYGRSRPVSRVRRSALSVGLALGLLGVGLGLFLLVGGGGGWPGWVMLLLGFAVLGLGFGFGGRRSGRTRYRPDEFLLPEWLTAASGMLCATGMILTSVLHPAVLRLETTPPRWPAVSVLAVCSLLLAALPAVAAPPAPLPGTTGAR